MEVRKTVVNYEDAYTLGKTNETSGLFKLPPPFGLFNRWSLGLPDRAIIELDKMNITKLIKDSFQTGLDELDIVLRYPGVFSHLEDFLKVYGCYAPFSVDIDDEDEKHENANVLKVRYNKRKGTFREVKWYLNYEDKFKVHQGYFAMDPLTVERDTEKAIVQNIIGLIEAGRKQGISAIEIAMEKKRYKRIEDDLSSGDMEMVFSIGLSTLIRKKNRHLGNDKEYILIITYKNVVDMPIEIPEFIPFVREYKEFMMEQDIEALYKAVMRCKENGFMQIDIEMGIERFDLIKSLLDERWGTDSMDIGSFGEDKERGVITVCVEYLSPFMHFEPTTETD